MAGGNDYHRGEMEIAEQVSTYHGFLLLSKWGSLTLVAVLGFFILWISAGASFPIAFLASAVFAVLGYLLLREKKSAGH